MVPPAAATMDRLTTLGSTDRHPSTLCARLEGVLAYDVPPDAITDRQGSDERDELVALLRIQDLHTAPLAEIGVLARWQQHPAVVALKQALEERLLWKLSLDSPPTAARPQPDDCVAELRRIATQDLLPPVYDWLVEHATMDEARWFLALEGGPDGGFDDLVAIAQVGLDGEPKLEMARNYWDEMGRGTAREVHTELHRQLSRHLDLRPPPRAEQPLTGLRRAALSGVLATNRILQPELVGALGLIEMQAGPRCRRVVAALERLGASDAALAFYVEHAEADPRHGKGWLDNVVAPLAEDPWWAEGMVRGARWRSTVNCGFFDHLASAAPSR